MGVRLYKCMVHCMLALPFLVYQFINIHPKTQ
uniref:Uncharacterized protein n=1 Tax=Rhizophora mucronata TaxID=61149 RepID=A0A2P2PQL1_RHIMU